MIVEDFVLKSIMAKRESEVFTSNPGFFKITRDKNGFPVDSYSD